jgi:hypothetical protein
MTRDCTSNADDLITKLFNFWIIFTHKDGHDGWRPVDAEISVRGLGRIPSLNRDSGRVLTLKRDLGRVLLTLP